MRRSAGACRSIRVAASQRARAQLAGRPGRKDKIAILILVPREQLVTRVRVADRTRIQGEGTRAQRGCAVGQTASAALTLSSEIFSIESPVRQASGDCENADQLNCSTAFFDDHAQPALGTAICK